MEARILHDGIFFLACISFSLLVVKIHGDIPIVNPTTPGATPITNPTNPPTPTTTPAPPTATGPPTTIGPPTTTGPPTSGGGLWCIANPSASEKDIQVALDYACGYAAVDCSPIQSNGACYDPDTVRDHASYAFNDYYSKNPTPTSCVFGGAAQLTNTDPSHGSCRFPSSSSGTGTSTPSPPRPTNPSPALPMPPPSPTTPMINPYPPAGNGFGGSEPGYDDGSEPTGTPNSSGTISLNLLLVITMNCLILSVSIANYS